MTTKYNDNNIFAKILAGVIPCNKVFEDNYALAFYDISPKAKIHVLVIPKGKFVTYHDFINNASADEVIGYNKAISTVINMLNISDSGYRLISNALEHGGQEVPHFHTHILAGEVIGAMRS